MYDIKDLVWEEHKNAERQEFVKTLMSGTIEKELYATYLYNQLQCYAELEKWGHHNGYSDIQLIYLEQNIYIEII